MLDPLIALSNITEQFHHWLIMILLCSARLFGVLGVLQATTSQIVQGRARSGIVVLISLFIAGGQPTTMFDRIAAPDLVLLTLKEAFLGLLIGYAAATVFWVAEGVGALIDNVAGYNNVQQQNPLSSAQSTPLSSLLLQLCVTIFYVGGGFLFLLEAVFETYRWWPVAAFAPVPAAILERFVLAQTDTLVTQMVKIASPILLVMLLIDLGFGLVAKTAGKLEPNSLAQPVKSATALLVMLLSLAVFIDQLSSNISLLDLKAQLQSWASVGAGFR